MQGSCHLSDGSQASVFMKKYSFRLRAGVNFPKRLGKFDQKVVETCFQFGGLSAGWPVYIYLCMAHSVMLL